MLLQGPPETLRLKSSRPTALAAIMPARANGVLFLLISDFTLSISAWWSPAGKRTLALPTARKTPVQWQLLRFAGPDSVDCAATIWHLKSRCASVCLYRIRGASCAREISASLTPEGRADVIAARNHCEEPHLRHLTRRKQRSLLCCSIHFGKESVLNVRCWLCRRHECRPMEPARALCEEKTSFALPSSRSWR